MTVSLHKSTSTVAEIVDLLDSSPWDAPTSPAIDRTDEILAAVLAGIARKIDGLSYGSYDWSDVDVFHRWADVIRTLTATRTGAGEITCTVVDTADGRLWGYAAADALDASAGSLTDDEFDESIISMPSPTTAVLTFPTDPECDWCGRRMVDGRSHLACAEARAFDGRNF